MNEQLLNVALLPLPRTPTAPPYCARGGGVAAALSGGAGSGRGGPSALPRRQGPCMCYLNLKLI